ncbi:hypothetical protein TIFTF001_040467 [Ficus carica]|uniref:Cyclic nucleotide-gated ion channel 4 n=1 Tax=Ficus carica TaxID=3494 RepID=A0AA87Z1R4_FICCA|nr:hypothetical protein TIFTF001_040464 [Ficus carica]GMN23513.1 hypothetical protein TIFTF001_040467 [Ficus carica]
MTTEQREIPRASNMQYFTDEESEGVENSEKEAEEEGIDYEEDRNESKGLLFYICGGGTRRPRNGWSLGDVLDPRAKWVQEWNRVFLFVCATGLFVDPLFFYALSISDTCTCLFVDGWFAVTVTVLRCMTDALHVWNMWLQLKMAKRSFTAVGMATAVDRSAAAWTTSRSVALRYLKAKRGFLFDLFVILPLPQVLI